MVLKSLSRAAGQPFYQGINPDDRSPSSLAVIVCGCPSSAPAWPEWDRSETKHAATAAPVEPINRLCNRLQAEPTEQAERRRGPSSLDASPATSGISQPCRRPQNPTPAQTRRDVDHACPGREVGAVGDPPRSADRYVHDPRLHCPPTRWRLRKLRGLSKLMSGWRGHHCCHSARGLAETSGVRSSHC